MGAQGGGLKSGMGIEHPWQGSCTYRQLLQLCQLCNAVLEGKKAQHIQGGCF